MRQADLLVRNDHHIISTCYAFRAAQGRYQTLSYDKNGVKFDCPKQLEFMTRAGVCFQRVDASEVEVAPAGKWTYLGSGTFNLAYRLVGNSLVLKFPIYNVRSALTDAPSRLVMLSNLVYRNEQRINLAKLIIDKHGDVIGSVFHYFQPKLIVDRSGKQSVVQVSDEAAAESICALFNDVNLVMVDGYISTNFIHDRENKIRPVDFGLLLETFNEDYPFRDTREDTASRDYWNFDPRKGYRDTAEYDFATKHFVGAATEYKRPITVKAIKACLYARRHGILRVTLSNLDGLSNDFDSCRNAISLERLLENEDYLTPRAKERFAMRLFAKAFLEADNEKKQQLWLKIFLSGEDAHDFSRDQRHLFCFLVRHEVSFQAAEKLVMTAKHYPNLFHDVNYLIQCIADILAGKDEVSNQSYIPVVCWLSRSIDSPQLFFMLQHYIGFYLSVSDKVDSKYLPALFGVINSDKPFGRLLIGVSQSDLKSRKAVLDLCLKYFLDNPHHLDVMSSALAFDFFSIADVSRILPFVTHAHHLYLLIRKRVNYSDDSKTLLTQESKKIFSSPSYKKLLFEGLSGIDDFSIFGDTAVDTFKVGLQFVSNAMDCYHLLSNRAFYCGGVMGIQLISPIHQLIFSPAGDSFKGFMKDIVPKDFVGRYLLNPENYERPSSLPTVPPMRVAMPDRRNNFSSGARLFCDKSQKTSPKNQAYLKLHAFVRSHFDERLQVLFDGQNLLGPDEKFYLNFQLDVVNEVFKFIQSDKYDGAQLFQYFLKVKEYHDKKVPEAFRKDFSHCLGDCIKIMKPKTPDTLPKVAPTARAFRR